MKKKTKKVLGWVGVGVAVVVVAGVVIYNIGYGNGVGDADEWNGILADLLEGTLEGPMPPHPLS